MSLEIFLMRHGIAEETSASGSDTDRHLTREGKQSVLEIACGLEALGVRPRVVLSSPLPRAMETATRTAKTINKKLVVERLESLGPGYDAEATLADLAGWRDAGSVLLVGHQPHLGELASLIMTGSPGVAPLPFKKGGVAAFEVDALSPQGAGALLWFLTPKQLRGLA